METSVISPEAGSAINVGRSDVGVAAVLRTTGSHDVSGSAACTRPDVNPAGIINAAISKVKANRIRRIRFLRVPLVSFKRPTGIPGDRAAASLPVGRDCVGLATNNMNLRQVIRTCSP